MSVDYLKVCTVNRETVARVVAMGGDVNMRFDLDCGLYIPVDKIHPDSARRLARLLNEAADIAERKRQQGEA